jgi:hypothetical protein
LSGEPQKGLNQNPESNEFYMTLKDKQPELNYQDLFEEMAKRSVSHLKSKLSDTRMLTTCAISGCTYCVTFEKELCMLCEEGRRLSPALDLCADQTVNITPIQWNNCSISNCEMCVAFQIGSDTLPLCYICKLGYRLMALNYTCVSKD